MRRLILAATAVLLVTPPAVLAAPTPGAYGENGAKGFRDILPPGTNGLVNSLQLVQFEAGGVRPKHNDDQLSMYADLVRATPGLSAADLDKYFKDSSFGVQPGHVGRTYAPRDAVTIVSDSAYGIPHIYAADRAGAESGIG